MILMTLFLLYLIQLILMMYIHQMQHKFSLLKMGDLILVIVYNLEKHLLVDECNKQLQNAISLLNKKQQDLILQVFYHNKTLSEIAKEKGISKSAITQQMQVIYKKLKEILKNF